MDNVLAPYLLATDDRERRQQLDELLTLRAAPLIRSVLLRRLGFYVSASGANENNQDAEDLYQEAMTRLVTGLNQLQSSADSDIENFELYVSRIAANTCTDFLRAKSPARTRLKYRLRDLLKRHKDFSSWDYDGEQLCGFADWRNRGKAAFAGEFFSDLKTELDSFESLHFADENVRVAPVSRIVSEIFHWIGGPVELDLLVRMIAYLLDVKDQQTDALGDPDAERRDGYFPAQAPSGELHLEANELLARLWRAVIQLSAEQRDAFAFGFEDQAGQDLFTLLLAAEIASWDELAHGMGRPVQELVRLRLRMPMDSGCVADELKASRQNVHKWRFRAIRRLKILLT